MIRAHVAALLAYVDKLDPSRAPITKEATDERLDAWADLLADVPPRAPHPEGRGWDASHAVRNHIATSPYPIKASDVSRPWHAFKADILGRHVGTFEPTAHPEIDPDADTGNAYTAALLAERQAIASGAQMPTTHRALLAGPPAEEVTKRLAALGTYMPPHVEDVLRNYRPGRTERSRLARAGLPDPLAVACPWEACRASKDQKCTTAGRPRSDFHGARLTAAATALARQEQPA